MTDVVEMAYAFINLDLMDHFFIIYVCLWTYFSMYVQTWTHAIYMFLKKPLFLKKAQSDFNVLFCFVFYQVHVSDSKIQV